MTFVAKPLSPSIAVGPQLLPSDMAFAARHYRSIINNRPDGEELGQPTSDELRTAAEALGLAYCHIPVPPGAPGDNAVVRFSDAVRALDPPVFAFCKTGTRATTLWALDAAARDDVDDIIKIAAANGYDLIAARPRLERIAGRTIGSA